MPLDCSIFDSQWIDHRVTPPCMGASGYRGCEIALFVLAECDCFIGYYTERFNHFPLSILLGKLIVTK